jgi:hypothetical protein
MSATLQSVKSGINGSPRRRHDSGPAYSSEAIAATRRTTAARCGVLVGQTVCSSRPSDQSVGSVIHADGSEPSVPTAGDGGAMIGEKASETEMPGNTGSFMRPNAIERSFGRILVALIRIGLVRGHFYVLEVRGRKTGRTISLPVDPIERDGRCYLVCARGYSNWVRNAGAAGEIVLVRARHRRRYAVRELPPPLRPPVLKAYLDSYSREVQRFFPVAKGSPVTAFDALAPRYPVFELQPIDDTATGAGAAAREGRP